MLLSALAQEAADKPKSEDVDGEPLAIDFIWPKVATGKEPPKGLTIIHR
jgi:hypothetical protein